MALLPIPLCLLNTMHMCKLHPCQLGVTSQDPHILHSMIAHLEMFWSHETHNHCWDWASNAFQLRFATSRVHMEQDGGGFNRFKRDCRRHIFHGIDDSVEENSTDWDRWMHIASKWRPPAWAHPVNSQQQFDSFKQTVLPKF